MTTAGSSPPRAPQRTTPPRPGERLLLVAALIALGLCLAGATAAWLSERSAREREKDATLGVARAAAAQADRFLQGRLDLLTVIAAHPSFRSGDPNAIAAYLALLPQDVPNIVNVAWVDRSGAVRARTPPNVTEPIDVADREHVQVVMATGKPHISAAITPRNPTVMGAAVVIAAPTRDASGAISGVLGNTITLERLEQSLGQFERQFHGALLVVDRANQLILDTSADESVTDVSGHPLVQRGRTQGAGVSESTTGLSGRSGRLIGVAHAPAGDWLVMVERPAADVFMPARRSFLITIVLLLGMSIAGITGAVWVGRKMDRLAVEQQRVLSGTEASLALLDTLLATAPIGFAFVDRDQRYVRINEALAAFDGTAVEEHLGRTVSEVLGERARVVTPIVQNVMDSGVPISGREVQVHPPTDPAGRARSYLISMYPVRAASGELLGAGMVALDITQRKRAEDALHFLGEASEALVGSLESDVVLGSIARLAVGSFADYCVIDVREPDGSLYRAAIAHRDPEREQALRTSLRFPPRPDRDSLTMRAIRTGRAELVTDAAEEMPETGPPESEPMAVARALHPVSAIAVPLMVADESLGAMLFVREGAGRRYTSVDVALAQVVARRAALTVENARLYRQAQDALRLRDEFLATISHDLRAPLTSIKGLAQLLRRRAQQMEGEQVAKLVEDATSIDAAATRMSAQIDELLDLSRMEGGQPLELNRRPVDLVALVRQAVAERQAATERHQITMSVAVDELIGVWDESRLERVLSNLISNAVKYSPAGGPVRVSVERSENGEGAAAIVHVQDEGLGIPEADLPLIFERFHRGGNVGAIRGTGIGLAGAKRIVEQHDGTIAVESEEGHGTTVRLRLPV